jgi:hypothetical protein
MDLLFSAGLLPFILRARKAFRPLRKKGPQRGGGLSILSFSSYYNIKSISPFLGQNTINLVDKDIQTNTINLVDKDVQINTIMKDKGVRPQGPAPHS